MKDETMELEKSIRIALRLETIKCNRIISGLAKKNKENCRKVFTDIYVELFGKDYTAFNNIYNPDQIQNRTSYREECILDHLDSTTLEYYIKCLNLIIDEVNQTGCSVHQALKKISTKERILFKKDNPILCFVLSIKSDIDKTRRASRRALIKNTTIVTPMHSNQPNSISMDKYKEMEKKFKKSTEEAYAIPDELEDWESVIPENER